MFEKINSRDKTLAKPAKRIRVKTQINRIRYDKGVSQQIKMKQRIIR
jgi:hypothetical protein